MKKELYAGVPFFVTMLEFVRPIKNKTRKSYSMICGTKRLLSVVMY